MPLISLAVTEIIKRRLFRAREHLQCLDPTLVEPALALTIADATYEYARQLKLPAVRHLEGHPSTLYLGDANSNLTTILESELDKIPLDYDVNDIEQQAVVSAQALMAGIHSIPLPSVPPRAP